jgi:hypothetical protein
MLDLKTIENVLQAAAIDDVQRTKLFDAIKALEVQKEEGQKKDSENAAEYEASAENVALHQTIAKIVESQVAKTVSAMKMQEAATNKALSTISEADHDHFKKVLSILQQQNLSVEIAIPEALKIIELGKKAAVKPTKYETLFPLNNIKDKI